MVKIGAGALLDVMRSDPTQHAMRFCYQECSSDFYHVRLT